MDLRPSPPSSLGVTNIIYVTLNLKKLTGIILIYHTIYNKKYYKEKPIVDFNILFKNHIAKIK